MVRTGPEIAARAMIYGALGFRASLEVTNHPRTEELCSRLLPWLQELGLGEQVEPLHREILGTPPGQLSPESRTEAYWRGESAWVLAWAIRLSDMPDCFAPVDPGVLVSDLRLLQPTAGHILTSAALRPQTEINELCRFCLEVRHQFQLANLPPDVQAKLNEIHRERLSQFGLIEPSNRPKIVDVDATELVAGSPNMTGTYIVRAMACDWLLGTDE